jgi:hypothetical protein
MGDVLKVILQAVIGLFRSRASLEAEILTLRHQLTQGWKTFLRDHAGGITSMDLFVVPTFSFRLLYGLAILRHSRRQILWLGVTGTPNRRMDCPATHRSLRLGMESRLHRPRS